MGKIINVRANNDPLMFQMFKRFVDQTEKNNFFVDGNQVLENPGVVADFRNIEHAYEIFKFLGNYWGGWNATPCSEEMYNTAKHWEEDFEAEIVDIEYDILVLN